MNKSIIRSIITFYHDDEYFSQLFRIALPITLQNFVFSSLNMASIIIIGQKGDTAVAAVGLAGQVYFLLNLILFGLSSGTGIFTAQLWGKRDIQNIRKVLSLTLRLSLSTSLIFFIASQFFPEAILSIYSTDKNVITVGAEYLRIFSWGYFFFAVTFAYVFVLRSTGNVRLPVSASVISLFVNAFFTYTLVFGKFGLPEVGVNGAAIANVIARFLECTILIAGVYLQKYSPAAATISDLMQFDFIFAWKIIQPVIPVALNELFWSFGITTYNIIFARMGTESIAAMNIYMTIDNMAFIFFIGLGSATAILVGNKIGAKDEKSAFEYAGRSIGLAVIIGVFIGSILLLLRTPLIGLFNVSPNVIHNTFNIMSIAGFAIWMRAANMVIIIGALRSGGDTMYSLILDGMVIWFVGVPLTAIGAFYFLLPIHYVYLLIYTEELTKFIFGLRRFFSKKWINNLANKV